MRKLSALLLLFAAPGAFAWGKEWLGYTGTYCTLSYPPGFNALLSMTDPEGRVEVARFIPQKGCDDLGVRDCARKRGAFELMAIPKEIVATYNGFTTFDSYIAGMIAESRERGERPARKKAAHPKLKAVTITLQNPGDYSTFTYVEGERAYYRFSYDSRNRSIDRVITSVGP